VCEGSQDDECCISIHNEWTEVEAYWNKRIGKKKSLGKELATRELITSYGD
jgi:hypothetical protein